MDGLTDFKIPLWIRRLITRFINIIPLAVAVFLGIEPLEILVLSQVALSLLIPLPLIPLILFTADKNIMGSLVNRKVTTWFAALFGIILLAFNGYLLYAVFILGESL